MKLFIHQKCLILIMVIWFKLLGVVLMGQLSLSLITLEISPSYFRKKRLLEARIKRVHRQLDVFPY